MQLIIDPESPLFDNDGMMYCEFPSNLDKIREYTEVIIQRVPSTLYQEKLVLEQQISEILKNAIKHGNKSDNSKNIKVFYSYTGDTFRIIVEDEGEGFKLLEEWNEFNRKRNEAIAKKDIELMLKYVTYKGPHSTDADGGNSLFAALEYWDSGLVYNENRNKVAALKNFYVSS